MADREKMRSEIDFRRGVNQQEILPDYAGATVWLTPGNYVYEFLGHRGTLFYVGLTNNFMNRWGQHVKNPEKGWMREVKWISLTRYESYKTAAIAERWIIQTRAPPFNKVYNEDFPKNSRLDLPESIWHKLIDADAVSEVSNLFYKTRIESSGAFSKAQASSNTRRGSTLFGMLSRSGFNNVRSSIARQAQIRNDMEDFWWYLLRESIKPGSEKSSA